MATGVKFIAKVSGRARPWLGPAEDSRSGPSAAEPPTTPSRLDQAFSRAVETESDGVWWCGDSTIWRLCGSHASGKYQGRTTCRRLRRLISSSGISTASDLNTSSLTTPASYQVSKVSCPIDRCLCSKAGVRAFIDK